jgi:hypothetical protein
VHDSPRLLHGWGSQTARAEVVVRREHITGHSYADFGFTRAYGHAAALKYAQDHGFEVVTDEAEPDGTRRLTLRRYT